MSKVEATYTQLRDGSWGAKVAGKATPNSTITVTKKSGETKQEVIYKVLWSGNDKYNGGGVVSICSLQYSTPKSSKEMCADCGQRPGVVMCSDSSGIRALCCSSCARMSSYERSFA